MLRSIPYSALAAAILGQFVANLAEGALGAVAIPCCDNLTPDVPAWYGWVATPVHFSAILLPGFICGLYVSSRPIVVGTIAAFVSGFLWLWLRAYMLAWLFPARAISGIGQFESLIALFYSPVF